MHSQHSALIPAGIASVNGWSINGSASLTNEASGIRFQVSQPCGNLSDVRSLPSCFSTPKPASHLAPSIALYGVWERQEISWTGPKYPGVNHFHSESSRLKAWETAIFLMKTRLNLYNRHAKRGPLTSCQLWLACGMMLSRLGM